MAVSQPRHEFAATGMAAVRILLYHDEILPLSTSILEITAQLEGIDAKQAASTEAKIQNEFESLGSRLSLALSLGLGAALLLAGGCLFYIFRIERQNNRRYQEVLKARGALEQLSARLVDAQEIERRTISRELHDEVGQTLNAVLVDAANLAKRIQADDAVSLRYLDNIRQFADSSVNSIRDIALLLRPSMLDDLGLIPALEWQAREVSRRSGIKVKVAAENVTDSLSDEMRTCIFRIVQEALQNVSRHSGAKSAVITVRQDASSLFLSVEDDGCGFDPERTRGLGMLGMEERVRQLSGQFQIRSAPGKGAALSCRPYRWRWALLNNPFPDSVENQFRHPVKVQLLEDVAAMRIHGIDTQMKEVGDFLIGPAFRHQLQDLAFAGSQKIVAILDVLVPDLANIIFEQHFADHGLKNDFPSATVRTARIRSASAEFFKMYARAPAFRALRT